MASAPQRKGPPTWARIFHAALGVAFVITLWMLAFLMYQGLRQSRYSLPDPVEHRRALSRSFTGLAPFFTPEVRYWEDHILRWAGLYGLDPNLVATVMQIESCGHPYAQSRAGARGLFQVMPYHFARGESPFDPETNARRGLAYLAKALKQAQGDVRLALAAYNGGLTLLEKPSWAWPQETLRYVRWGVGIYQDAVQGREHSPTLQAWLAAGGAHLCQQAQEVLSRNP